MKTGLVLEGTLKFNDSETATVTLTVTSNRVRYAITGGGVTNHEVWDRAHVVRLQVTSPRPGEWVPSLLLRDGRNMTLGIVLDADGADRLASAF